MKASFTVMLITAPLFFISGIVWFWAVLQFIRLENNLGAFFATAIPFLLAWTIFQRWLAKKLKSRWADRERINQAIRP